MPFSAAVVLGIAWIGIAAPSSVLLAALGLVALALYHVRLYPRMTIDITWGDILTALRFAIWPSGQRAVLEASIARQWSKSGDAFPCLAVRTGIDLILAELDLPEGSEVLFAPGISIPAVVDIVKGHKLKPVGLDPPSGADLLPPRLGEALTDKSKVLVITHLFGSVLESTALIKEAKDRGLFVIEDCAQAFVGKSASSQGGALALGFRGHAESDATLVSFGFMKTLTCLGGAVCCVRDKSLRERVMRRQASYGVRPNGQFLGVALKACVIKLVGNAYLWGLFASLVSALGRDFDELIVGSVRGFPNEASFRLRPSVPLLQLLEHRLRAQQKAAYEDTALSSLARRRAAAARTTQRLAAAGVELVSSSIPRNSNWLLPITDEEPRSLVRGLWAQGFDATCSSTQLTSVEKGKGGAYALMKDIVYLPITPGMPLRAADALADAVLKVREQRGAFKAEKKRSLAVPGKEAAFCLLALAAVLVTFPSVLLPFLPSLGTLLYCCGAGAVVATVMLFLARICAAEPQLCVHRELLHALRPKPRPEGLMYWSTRPALEERVNGAVLLTGSTGFVGGGILFALLARAEELGISKVVLLVRKKGNKGAAARVAELKAMPAFEEVKEKFEQLVVALEGDTAQMDFAWQDPETPWPFEQPLKVVLHCAGDVRFDQPLQQAAVSLVSGTLQVAELAARWHAKRFVFVSTAFVHAVPGGKDFLGEKLVELRDFDPLELYRDAVNHGGWAEKAMRELGFPNTYTFAKAVAEHLVVRTCAGSGVEAKVVRPSIVGPAWAAPRAGWSGEKASTIVAGAALLSGRALRLFRTSEHPCPLVPVDMVAETALRATVGSGESILHATVDASEAVRVASFKEMMDQLWRMLALAGEFSLPEAGLLCRLQRWGDSGRGFWLLHGMLNVLPNSVYALLALAAQWAGLGKDDGKASRALARYTSLPVLYLPFTCPSSPWLFRSKLRLPDNWDPVEYTVLIHRAALGFVRTGGKGPAPESAKLFQEMPVVARRSMWHDAVVTFGMPGSPLPMSLAAFVIRRVLQWMDLTVIVDVTSLISVTELNAPLVLCPTHRSLLDFVIIGLSCFQLRNQLPVMQVPHVAADAEFATLPILGRVLAALGAFFVRRGGGTVQPDPTLRAEVGRVFKEGRPLEVFLEGLRSRGRRHMRLRTGLLRALRDVSQRPVALVPLGLSYELLPEDQTFYSEICGLPRPPLSGLALLEWVFRGLRGRLPKFGCAYVELGKPQVMDGSSNLQELLSSVQDQLVQLTSVTELHARALAQLLELPCSVVSNAFSEAGLPLRESSMATGQSLSEAQLWPLALQAIVLIRKRLPRAWANWIVEPVVERRRPAAEEENPQAADEAAEVQEKGKPSSNMETVVAALASMLEEALGSAQQRAAELRQSGVQEVTEEHLLQQLQSGPGGPPLLARGAAALAADRQKQASEPAQAKPACVTPLWPSAQRPARQQNNEEALDRWGFKDTQFKAQWVNGQPAVQITSSRYGAIASRPSHKLWAVFREELRVNLSVRETLQERPLPELPAPAAGLLQSLAAAVPEARVRGDAEARLRAGTGQGLQDVWRLRAREVQRMPDAVVRPESEEEVLAVLKAAAADVGGFAVVPVGGRTNVTSATSCPSKEEDARPFVALDMRGLAKLLWLSEEDGAAQLEAGITGSALKEVLAKKGVTMGMEPDSMEFSTLGGWIATRASGMKRAKYGNIEDMILEVRVATPQGMLWQRHGSNVASGTVIGRSSTGLELTGLTLGSEGCLGVVTSAVVRVRPLPEATCHESVIFPEWTSGAAWMREVARLAPALRPASCRLLDSKQLKLARAVGDDPSVSSSLKGQVRSGLKQLYLKSRGVALEAAAAVTLTFEGSREEVALQQRVLRPLVSKAGGIWGGSEKGAQGYALTFAIAYLRDFGLDYHILSESLETFAPWSVVKGVWPAVVEAVEEEHSRLQLPGRPFLSCRMTQLYDEGAVLYMYLAVSTNGLSPLHALEAFQVMEHAARAAALEAGGSLTHHHGVGKLRAKLLPACQAPALAPALHSFKTALDPCSVLGARNGTWAM